MLAKQLGTDVLDSTAPDWVDELMDLDIDVALFAHDLAQWRPPTASFVGSRVRDGGPAGPPARAASGLAREQQGVEGADQGNGRANIHAAAVLFPHGG